MNRVRVLVATDRLTAEVQIGPGAPAAPGELGAALAAAGVVHGLDAEELARLAPQLADRHLTARAVVARGTPPQPGRDGEVVLSFATAPLAGHRGGDDSLDYRERALLHPAAAGAEVARIVPPVPGIDGRDVLGRALPAPPTKVATLRLGPGTVLRADGVVLANRDGVVTTPAGGIDVVPLYVHQGDVDLHSGNLHSHGSIEVGGDLHAGFQVEADGDIAVAGSSFGGAILAGGSVTIALGAQAGSRIQSGGDIDCRHATSSTLAAAGTLSVHDELVHCQAAAARIEMVEGRGHALGGELRAAASIELLVAGSPSGAATLLAAADLTSSASELVRRTRQLERIERKVQKQPEAGRGSVKGGKFGRQRTAAADAAQAEKLERLRQQRELLRTARVRIRNRAHLGVRIQIGTAVLALPRDCGAACFRWDDTGGTIVHETP